MPKATLSLAKKSNAQGEHHILVRLDITRTNRPQFKSIVTVKPENFVDGEIKVPSRGKLNMALRESLLQKKKEIEAFVASISAIAMALPEQVQTRNDILEVYEVVKTVNPAEISRTTIIAKKRELNEANMELVRQLQEARRPNVMEYVRRRIKGMEDGTIKRKGNNYTYQTLHTYKGFANVLEIYSKEHPFDWDDVGNKLIDSFVLFLEKDLGYMKKTINKNLAVFCAMLNSAFKEGFRFNTTVLESFPKLQVKTDDKVVEIYLTKAELQALYDMRLRGEEAKVRDVFLVGCYTSQRYSDYSRIRQGNISFHDGIGIITLTQQKTGTEISIPILDDNLLRILEKYDYNLPYLSNYQLNKGIKTIVERLSKKVPSFAVELPTRLTKIQQRMEQDNKVVFKRNERGEVLIPRYSLVTTHTARRTGITLMYLDKILDTHEMMSISGHKTESVFFDYIKLSGVEMAAGIGKKVIRARKEAEVKALLLKEFESMSTEELAGLLELARERKGKNTSKQKETA
ncbi:MAG: site-specific integrase [Bacteroidales bacterium]|nr:site-specific integrase [Bacteroidales bacterium]MCM1146452.1 site-specific integrase [Bacteroidales bacterium]MCM1205110.1 site-specific integrase [Bacillota bacterium]MCM1509356.1 site-specific integrase [Clostridium sp.]